MNETTDALAARPPRIFASILALIGLVLAVGGAWLVSLGGTPYYLVAGALIVGSAALLWRGSRRGAWLYVLVLIGTAAWALWEVGLDAWALMPRLLFLTVLGAWLLTPWARRGLA